MLVSRPRQCEKNDTVLTVNYRLSRYVCASCLIDKGQKGMLNCIKKLRKDDSRIGSEYEKEKKGTNPMQAAGFVQYARSGADRTEKSGRMTIAANCRFGGK